MADEYEHCTVCGGWGVGLVTNVERICAHCARAQKTFFDPDTCDFCRDGYIDISPKADGGVLKKILKDAPSTDGKFIEEGCPTFIQYVGRLDDGSIFETTRDVVDGKNAGGTDDPFEFHLGRGKVIEGLDIAVATMNLGEIARFIIKPEYGYGVQGLAPKVEPNEVLDYEIELVSFGKPLPKFPSQAELAESRKRQNEEDRKMLEENPPPTVDERLASSNEYKELGNQAVKAGDFAAAQKHYDTGFVHIFYGKDEWEVLVSADDKVRINHHKVPLYLNRALCKIKLEKWDDAEWDCDKAIELSPENVKGHFRRGLVFTGKLREELAKEERKEFWVIDKANKFLHEAEKSLEKAMSLAGGKPDGGMTKATIELKRSKVQLQQYIRNYHEAEKKLYKEKIMDRMVADNKKLQQAEKQKEMEEEFADMPSLE
ncbi:hypothetical protein SPRG_09869 [Saprolegnia parasitica CBS 223.65]|uniref:peptidylprolyl isomerase n=1 Tax=Saprolegnia parasitica (strain CBS 223.65) TaxID=695850 RepID=A0A067C157_SAPPC|nr:hypothetical protein SPRG_09869 [Saprolegnia parasitica CBS 223.65]KDO24233.1 hypothetical protein SPRG_09869 [Saprolegnia parasitica CBS 223.65]|eukprot:XP_012205009.1 hypothetical protein SPRG_09869 [Saprolegnia parasitica CBS 223.65]